ncbi:MAG: GDP-mannose 4,6-dehydratase [Alphaproteobacteria bacterium]|nr:GDP-mannose 4,6-dehydratase [Alphaproteobacteria bacterium]
MASQSLLVIGANSFSGQDFVDLALAETDLKIIGVSRSPQRTPLFLRYLARSDLARYSYHQLDMNQDIVALLALIDRERPSHIINFAAQSEVAPSWDHPEHWFQTNTVALSRLVNHLRNADYLERYLHISSPEAYGSCSGNVTEETHDNPSTPYAASKAAADMLIRVYQKQYGFPASFIRATNVYGARQQLYKIIPRTAIYLRLGKTIDLHGGGRAVKSYIHIRDVSRGELSALLKGRIGQMYHLSPDAGVAVRDVVRMICETQGHDFETATRTVDERAGQDAAYVIDSTLARREFGWKPQIAMQEGVFEVVDWVNSNFDDILRLPLAYEHKP